VAGRLRCTNVGRAKRFRKSRLTTREAVNKLDGGASDRGVFDPAPSCGAPGRFQFPYDTIRSKLSPMNPDVSCVCGPHRCVLPSCACPRRPEEVTKTLPYFQGLIRCGFLSMCSKTNWSGCC